jgi:hypothetical protein
MASCEGRHVGAAPPAGSDIGVMEPMPSLPTQPTIPRTVFLMPQPDWGCGGGVSEEEDEEGFRFAGELAPILPTSVKVKDGEKKGSV